MSAISTQLAHGIKATTTTAGTGSVTLAALASFMLPLARFAVGSLMSYSIQDGNNREWGIGTVQSGNVLDRTTITGTLVAGTYTTGGAAMTLSGGQCIVECSEHEGSALDKVAGLSTDANGNTVLVGADGPINVGLGTGLRAVYYGHSYIDEEDIRGSYCINGTLAHGTVTWANALLGKPFTVIKGAGVGGERIADIIQRYALHVAPYDPDIIFISIGHNDLNNYQLTGNQIGTGIPYATDATQTYLTSVTERFGTLLDLIPRHVLVVLMAETQPGRTPAGVASPHTHKQLGSRFAAMNLVMQRMALSRKNVMYVPVDLPIMDAASGNFEVAIGMYKDNVHTSVIAAYKRGKMLAKYLERVIPRAIAAPLASNVGDAFQTQRLPFTAISGNGTNITVTMDNSAPGNHATIGRIKVGDMVNVQCPTTAAYEGTYPCVAATTTSITLAGAATGTTASGYVCIGRQMLENPVFTTQTGGTKNANITLSSGALPGSYYLNTTAGAGIVSVAVSYIPHSDPDNLYSCGHWLELDITTTDAAEVILQGTASDESGGPYRKRLHANEVFYAGCEAWVLGTIVNFKGLEMRALMDMASDTISADFYRGPNYTGTDGPTEEHRITLATPETQVQVGAVGVTAQLYMRFSAAGSAKIRVARMSCYRVDDPVRTTEKLALQ